MQVILTEDVESVGRVGDTVSVKAGFGRNYLLPQGKALLATKANVSLVEERRKIYEAKALKAREEAAAFANRIHNLEVTVTKKAGEGETLYGSVTPSDIAEALEKEGIVVDKRRVLISEPIKALGVYQIPIRLHPEITAELKLWVAAEE